MAMDLGGAKGGVKSDINVTPLVDVMLVLLIIMMLIAPMLQQGVSGHAADSDEHRRQARAMQEQTVLAISRKQGVVRQREAGAPSRSSRRRINELLENKTEKIVVIKADEEVEYGAVDGRDGPARGRLASRTSA